MGLHKAYREPMLKLKVYTKLTGVYTRLTGSLRLQGAYGLPKGLHSLQL